MTQAANDKNGRRLLDRFRRSPAPLLVEGYHIGNIQSEKPLFVDKKAAIVGNILAPAITVKGKVYGACVAMEMVVQQMGEVWGDIHAHSVIMEPGGKALGWIFPLTEDEFQDHVENGELPIEVTLSGQPDLPFELQTENIQDRSQAQIDALHRLQVEVGTALAARKEIEANFTKRVNEIAGGSTQKINELETQITAVQAKLSQTEAELTEAHDQIQQLNEANQQITEELDISKKLLTSKTNEFDTLTQAHQSKTSEYETLSTAKTDLEVSLHNAQNENETLRERIQSLEAALQASLQHSAEQEESLLRWQELVESNQKKVEEIEQELQSAQFQLEENAKVTELVRAQRAQAEAQWQETTNQVDDLNLELSAQRQELEAAQEINHSLAAELDALRQRPPDEKLVETERLLDEAMNRITELETALFEADQTAEEHMEQHLWAKASLQTTQLKLDELQNQLDAVEKHKTALQAELATQQEAVAAASNRQAELTEEMETAVAQVEASKKELAAQNESLQESLMHMQVQIEAYEAEIEHHLGQIKGQGQRLAEAQALLVERDLTVTKLEERIAKQADFIKRMKTVTSQHIEQLKTQLAQAKQNK